MPRITRIAVIFESVDQIYNLISREGASKLYG
jgi:hypothetical protein